jgi:hypothetical protein
MASRDGMSRILVMFAQAFEPSAAQNWLTAFQQTSQFFPGLIVGQLTPFPTLVIFGCNRKICFPQSVYIATLC